MSDGIDGNGLQREKIGQFFPCGLEKLLKYDYRLFSLLDEIFL